MTASDRVQAVDDPVALRARLDAVIGDVQRRWLDDALDEARADPASLPTRFPAVGRKVGRATLDRTADRDDVHAWTVDDAARALLLAAANQAGAGAALVESLYRQGDTAERRAVLRALPLLNLGDGVVTLVLDAIRTNDGRLIAAALGPYAAAHLDDHAWAQAVLKCVFLGVPLAGVAGLRERADAGLARMLADYAHERVAAGRDVPADVWPVVRRYRPAELAKLEAELDSADPARRSAARRALDTMATAATDPDHHAG
jgi:hypothetical protein